MHINVLRICVIRTWAIANLKTDLGTGLGVGGIYPTTQALPRGSSGKREQESITGP